MTRRDDTHPHYRQGKVEAVILEVAAELHPSRSTEDELIGRIVGKPDDEREVETARRALGRLREYGVVADRQDGTVQITPAALRAVTLLTGMDGER